MERDRSKARYRKKLVRLKKRPIRVTRFGAIHIGRNSTHLFQKGVKA